MNKSGWHSYYVNNTNFLYLGDQHCYETALVFYINRPTYFCPSFYLCVCQFVSMCEPHSIFLKLFVTIKWCIIYLSIELRTRININWWLKRFRNSPKNWGRDNTIRVSCEIALLPVTNPEFISFPT